MEFFSEFLSFSHTEKDGRHCLKRGLMGICGKWLFYDLMLEWKWKYRVSGRGQFENETGAYRKFACTLYTAERKPPLSRSHL